MTKKILLIVIIVIIIIITLFIIYQMYFLQISDQPQPRVVIVTDFDQCVKEGFTVRESYPRQCDANGQTFIEEIGNVLEKEDIITINNPRPNQLITSPLEITGQARGIWYFEADFPIKLYDDKENLLVSHYAVAKGEWMTEDFVPFSSEIEFETPATKKGWLVLEKDNPSNLDQLDDQLRIPVRFK